MVDHLAVIHCIHTVTLNHLVISVVRFNITVIVLTFFLGECPIGRTIAVRYVSMSAFGPERGGQFLAVQVRLYEKILTLRQINRVKSRDLLKLAWSEYSRHCHLARVIGQPNMYENDNELI